MRLKPHQYLKNLMNMIFKDKNDGQYYFYDEVGQKSYPYKSMEDARLGLFDYTNHLNGEHQNYSHNEIAEIILLEVKSYCVENKIQHSFRRTCNAPLEDDEKPIKGLYVQNGIRMRFFYSGNIEKFSILCTILVGYSHIRGKAFVNYGMGDFILEDPNTDPQKIIDNCINSIQLSEQFHNGMIKLDNGLYNKDQLVKKVDNYKYRIGRKSKMY